MPRRAARVDGNQARIVKALRAVGAEVQPLHMVGHGCPDLLVSFRDVNYVMEIKDPVQKPSDRCLTPDEQRWHDDWRAPVHIILTEDEALRAIGAI